MTTVKQDAASQTVAVVSLDSRTLCAHISAILQACCVAASDADLVADALVSADLDGVQSHGCSLVPLYVARLRAGSVQAQARPVVDADLGALVTVDAGHGLGQVSSRFATDLAMDRARLHGIGMVAVRHAFHFGAAAYWVRRMADEGMVGVALSNTRPLMPAPGGARRVVGNNPLAIALPAAPGEPVVVDMAMSASAMGKIRLAHARGASIPEGWASDAQGRSTTSPAEAIKGMLLPAAGAKGFGLAVAIDLLCGALSGGAVGPSVQPLYGQDDVPYDCAHAFIAIDADRASRDAANKTAAFAAFIRQSVAADGVGPVYAPGDLERARRAASAGICTLDCTLYDTLNTLADDAGLPPLMPNASSA